MIPCFHVDDSFRLVIVTGMCVLYSLCLTYLMTQCILLSYSTYWYYCIDDSLTISLYTTVHVEKKKQTHSTYVIKLILSTVYV